VSCMGMLHVLLDWSAQDPVDDLERRRNAVVFLFQGNRNPFIDHPEWIDIVFAGAAPPEPTSTPLAGIAVWINELHYDNQGADSGEFVEVAGTAGVSLSGWTLVTYNGNGGRKYGAVALGGTIPNTQSVFGVLAFDLPGLQNGSPDGLALVDAAGVVVQFLSYEGRFTAADGAAFDIVSADIGVEEPDATPAGHSLPAQRTWARRERFPMGSSRAGNARRSQYESVVSAVTGGWELCLRKRPASPWREHDSCPRKRRPRNQAPLRNQGPPRKGPMPFLLRRAWLRRIDLNNGTT